MSNSDADHFSKNLPDSSPEQPLHSELLDQVLKWSSHSSDEQLLNQAMDAAEDHFKIRQALLEVARRHQGQTVSPEEFCYLLVKTILLHDFERVSGSWQLETTAREVAGTIAASPNSRNRLERLWRQLNEALP